MKPAADGGSIITAGTTVTVRAALIGASIAAAAALTVTAVRPGDENGAACAVA